MDMTWQPIERPPETNIAVLVYYANLVWEDQSGALVSLGDIRDHVERTKVGFYDDGVWRESGTSHDMFEGWRTPDQLPTHWQPLPEPPQS